MTNINNLSRDKMAFDEMHLARGRNLLPIHKLHNTIYDINSRITLSLNAFQSF